MHYNSMIPDLRADWHCLFYTQSKSCQNLNAFENLCLCYTSHMVNDSRPVLSDPLRTRPLVWFSTDYWLFSLTFHCASCKHRHCSVSKATEHTD